MSREIEDARRQGKTVVEADVRYGEFAEYCASRGMKPDAAKLLEFVSRQKPLGEA